MLLEVRDMLWGTLGTVLLIAAGLYFTVKTHFVQLDVSGNLKGIRSVLCKKSGFASAATALGGTIGAGSVVGISIGLAAGGAGSVFWMWVSGFFGMALRYAETKYAFSDRVMTKNGYIGGAMVSLERQGSKSSATVFCIAAIFVSLGTGNMTQVGSVASSLEALGVDRYICGLAAALVFGIVVLAGKRAILAANSVLVPLCCAVYLLSLLPVLTGNIGRMGDVLCEIFGSAFGIDAMTGGFTAYAFSRAVREGISRGVFSNESGMGSAPLAYCASDAADAEAQSRLGIAEIFTDTYIISTLTALCLLCGEFDSISEMMLCCYGRVGETALAVMLCVFALASMLCWHYYASVCIDFIPHGDIPGRVYPWLSVIAAFLGAVIPQSTVWAIADIFNLLMVLPNLYMLFLKVRKVNGDKSDIRSL